MSITKAGDIPTIVNCMGAHRVHDGVQEQGCRVLANLASNAANKVLLAVLGGIAVIVSGMEAHRAHAGIQEKGCRALCALSTNHDGIRQAIAKAGGIAAIVNGMLAHHDRVAVQKRGCLTLYNLSLNPKVALLIEAGGGVHLLVLICERCARQDSKSLHARNRDSRSPHGRPRGYRQWM